MERQSVASAHVRAANQPLRLPIASPQRPTTTALGFCDGPTMKTTCQGYAIDQHTYVCKCPCEMARDTMQTCRKPDAASRVRFQRGRNAAVHLRLWSPTLLD